MFNNISFYMIAGKPLIMWGGIALFLLLISTATIGALVMKGKANMNMHKAFAITTIVFGVLHGVLGVLSFF